MDRGLGLPLLLPASRGVRVFILGYLNLTNCLINELAGVGAGAGAGTRPRGVT